MNEPKRSTETPATARDPAQQAGVLVLGTTLATVSSAILPLVLVRLLGKADLAELLALVLVYDTVALVLATGFPQTLMYHLPGRPEAERRAIARHVGWVMAGLGAVAAVVLGAVGWFGDDLPGLFSSKSSDEVSLAPLVVLAPSLVAELPFRIVTNLLVAEHRAQAASIIGVLRTIGTTLATLVPVALGADIWMVAICYSASRALFGLALPLAIRWLYQGAPRIPSPVATRTLVRFAVPLGATDVVSLLNQQFDRWLVLLSFTAVAFAEYQAGAWQVPVISTIAYSVGSAYMPSLVEHFKSGRSREAIELWRANLLKVSLIVVPTTVGFMVAAEELMELLFTREYLSAAPVFRLYSVLTLGRVTAFGPVIIAAGAPRYVLQAAVFSFLSNVALSVPLTFWLGFQGPALGTALAFFPMVAFYVWCIARAAKLPFSSIYPLFGYSRVLGLSLLAGVVAFIVKVEVPFGPMARLLLSMATTLVVFAIAGTATKTIGRRDWQFVWDWARLRVLR